MTNQIFYSYSIFLYLWVVACNLNRTTDREIGGARSQPAAPDIGFFGRSCDH
jgi:hypothetical protein